MNYAWRKTSQYLLPERKTLVPEGQYDIYPALRIYDGQIFEGLESLADLLKDYKSVIIDCYTGVFYHRIMEKLQFHLNEMGYKTTWYDSSLYLIQAEEIDLLIHPFLDTGSSLLSRGDDLKLEDFFDMDKLSDLAPSRESDINIIIGPGASLAGWNGLLVYIDIPKNEILYRATAGSITNLGALSADDPLVMFRRFYYIDWEVLNKHKKQILFETDIIVDAQRPDFPVWMDSPLLRRSLKTLSNNLFRTRPWFETGKQGGTWIKNNIDGLNKDVPSYELSNELNAPVNGLLFDCRGILMEVSFDTLMYLEGEAVMGDLYKQYGNEFPLRFNLIDNIDGGNQAVRYHPTPESIKSGVGEKICQEETFYILNADKDARIYLGFRDNIDPARFKDRLEKSADKSFAIDINEFVKKQSTSKHDLFLIPSGTIYGSGNNNLILEIGTTPDIFNFNLINSQEDYRNDSLTHFNIKSGFGNLSFATMRVMVNDNMIALPELIGQGEDWQLYHLPTNENCTFNIHRWHFRDIIKTSTDNKFHVLSLVQGISIIVETENGFAQKFSFAETFIIPAAAGNYRLINKSDSEVIVLKVFMKEI